MGTGSTSPTSVVSTASLSRLTLEPKAANTVGPDTPAAAAMSLTEVGANPRRRSPSERRRARSRDQRRRGAWAHWCRRPRGPRIVEKAVRQRARTADNLPNASSTPHCRRPTEARQPEPPGRRESSTARSPAPHTQRRVHDGRSAVGTRQRLRFQQRRALLGEVAQNLGNPADLALAVTDRLPISRVCSRASSPRPFTINSATRPRRAREPAIGATADRPASLTPEQLRAQPTPDGGSPARAPRSPDPPSHTSRADPRTGAIIPRDHQIHLRYPSPWLRHPSP